MRSAKAARLQIQLLGTFSVALGGVPLTQFRSTKVRALPDHLAPQRAGTIAATCWLLCWPVPPVDPGRAAADKEQMA
jgi:DNA-binding SARP family transcriptional activator